MNASVRYRTKEVTAKDGKDFIKVEGILEFEEASTQDTLTMRVPQRAHTMLSWAGFLVHSKSFGGSLRRTPLVITASRSYSMVLFSPWYYRSAIPAAMCQHLHSK